MRQIRRKWRTVRIVLRADSGFAREELMAWCEANGVDYVFGLARNERLEKKIAPALQEARLASRKSDQAARVFRDFMWSTLDSWSRRRRIVAKAEWTTQGANPRFVVTSLVGRHGGFTRISTVPAATWRTGSRSVSSTSTPAAPALTPCAPISCGSGSPRLPTS